MSKHADPNSVFSELQFPEAGGDSAITPRTACITLDLESDYATDHFHALDLLGRLDGFCRSAGVPLTVFVEGRVFREQPQALEELDPATEFALHCDDHRRLPDTSRSLSRAVESFRDVLGYRPSGYRAGRYQLTAELLEALCDEGFEWDASCLLPGFSERRRRPPPDHAYRLSNGLWELPVGVSGLGVPFTMSWLSLLGFPAFRRVRTPLRWPALLVFVVHMVDLGRTPALSSASMARRLVHGWNYRFGASDPFLRLQRFIELLSEHMYRFSTCGRVVDEAMRQAASQTDEAR